MSSLGKYYLEMWKINYFWMVDVMYYKKKERNDTIQKSEKTLMELDSIQKI